jgi:uncharacterized protein involved in exopolysaccharide biosynthesis
MTRRDILVFVFKWKATILLVFTIVVASVALLVYLLPPTFSARASVLVERNRSPVTRSTFVPVTDLVEVMTSESEIIVSRTVMANVVDRLKPHERPVRPSTMRRLRDGVSDWLADVGLIDNLSPREKWIIALQKQVSAKPVSASDVIAIRYDDEDPEWAARIANAVTNAYIEHHLQIFSKTRGSDLFRRQMEASDQTLQRLRARIADLKSRSSVSAIEENRKGLVQSASSLRDQRVKAQTELSELLTRFQPDHEKVKAAAATVARLDALLAGNARRLQELEQVDGSLKELELAVQAEEVSFRDYKQRYDEARLGEATDVTMVNVRVVDYAAQPERPTYSRLFLIAIAIAGGLALAILVAIVREYFDRRVFNPDLAEKILGIPSLGSVPRVATRSSG